MLYLDLDEMDEINNGKQNDSSNKLIIEIQQHADKADSSDRPSLKNPTPAPAESKAIDCSQSWATTLFNIAKICVFAIFLISILLILIKISSQEGTVILPFEVSGNENISGIAIADQLTAELTQIQKIHSIKNEAITIRTKRTSFTINFSPENAFANREMVVPKAETVEFGMGEIGSIDTGSGSLSIGRLIIAFQNLLPGPKSITTIRGSLQRYESSTVLVGLLEGDKVQSWIVTRPSGNNEDQPYEMIRSLAFMIALDLQQTDVSAKTWQGLKCYTMALDAYHQYQRTGDPSFLYLAGNSSIDAIRFEKKYQRTYDELASIESLYIVAGRQNDALEYCNKTIELDPMYPSAWINKGAVLLNIGKYGEAIKAYDKALWLDRTSSLAWSSKGIALNGIGKYDEAIEAFDEAIKLDSRNENAWNGKGNSLTDLGKYDQAIEAYDEAIKLDKSTIAWSNKGYSLHSQGKYDEAIEAYDEAIKLDPKYSIAWNEKGNSLYSQGKYDEAIEAYDEAIKLDPQSAIAWSNKGYSLHSQGKYDEAIEVFDEAIMLDPELAYAWNGKGNSLHSQGKYDEAIEAYDEAIKLEPQSAAAWSNKGYSLHSQGKYDEAIEAYDEAIKLDPKLAYAWNGKGNSLHSQGKYDEAIEAYDEAIMLDPKSTIVWSNKGYSLYSQGKIDEARTIFNKSKELGYIGPPFLI